ncbi:prolyl oligopeptidase family serine peptidase [Chryseolinea sp. T2]|uniref:prolyl oligopeptidase family serine peptidase n=1 Tax=Chryseolinea sp. T2 TaxID=3129255 RepID=UPI0030781C35
MKSMTLLLSLAFIVVLAACSKSSKTENPSSYPVSKKGDTVDVYFGESVADPYRWMENDTSAEVADWVAEENKVTFGFLGKIPYREEIRTRLETLNNYEKLGSPFTKGEYIYYFRNEGLQNHSVLYRRKGEQGEPEVFLDPNTFSSDGTTRLADVSFSKDGSRLAYLISKGGQDWTEAIIIDASSKKILEDTIQDIKFSGIAWQGNDGFYFSTYEKPKGSQLSAKTQSHKLYYHRVGTPRSDDKIIFGDDKNPRRYVSGSLTEDERFLVVSAATSTTGNELYIQDLHDPKSSLVVVVNNFDNNHGVVTNKGSRILLETNLNAPNNRLVEFDFANPLPQNWKDVIPETKDVLNTSTGGGYLFANYMIDVKSQIRQYDLNGKLVRSIELPGIGTAGGFSAEVHEKVLYYSFTSFTYPTTIFRYDIASGKSSVYYSPKVDFNPEDYETKQVFYTSKDGTKVPMFIVYKKGVELNGKNPTWLYAYGGFNISLTPGFSPSRMMWLENGGIYAQPNLRGGGEYGEKWHLAGTKLNKQNVFDDFIAAGEYLIKEKYTSSQYLAIAGGSNGGLLVGATMTQRPDLAKVALPAVGVMDMLRYHKFTAGAGWAYDYGTADDSKEMFEYLKRYSPVHALKPNTAYPATMVTTADHDDRVVPAHSFKFAATLQEANSGPNPVLIRIDTKSGHGASNLSKAIETTADQYAFAWYNMGIVPPLVKKGL